MFLNFIMLAGLGGAAAPLVLHLLARARFKTVDWGAMMFLEGVEARQQSSARLKQWLLLLMRMLLVALVAMALARPVLRSAAGGLGSEGRTTAVIVLDRSYSLAYEEAGRSRFEKAKEAVLQILASLRRGDEVSLVLLGEQVELPYREPTSNLQEVARQVSELPLSDGSADMPRGLAIARQILDQPSRRNRELYVVCDHQASSWQGVDNSGAFAQWVHSPDAPTRFMVIPVGGEESDNVAIESVELTEPLAVRGAPVDVEVKLRNYSWAPRVGMELTLSFDSPRPPATGRKPKTVLVTVGPRQSATVRVPMTFDQLGSHILSAEVKAPGLESDNRFDCAVDVIEPLPTLIVSGDEGRQALRRESFYLQAALSPYALSVPRRLGDSATVTISSAEELSSVALSQYQVIILANVPQLSAQQVRALEQRVYEGAGLIVSPGSLARVENYNTLLYRDGLGLLPGKLETATSGDGSRATSLVWLDSSHPIFRFHRPADALPVATVGRFFPLAQKAPDARILATYASGDAYLIEATRGRGRVLLITTPLDADWSTIPLTSFYLPFVQSLVRYANAATPPSRNLQLGRPIVVNMDEPMDSVTVTRWDDKPERLTPDADQSQITYAATQRPGVYRVELRSKAGRSRFLHYVVQSLRLESDLTPLPPERWKQLERAMGFVQAEAADESLTPQIVAARRGHELWLGLLAGALLLGLAEMGLARRWSREGK